CCCPGQRLRLVSRSSSCECLLACDLGAFGGDTPIEAVPGQDEALMGACADLVDPVMGGELEARARSPHLDAFSLNGHRHSRRRCGLVRDIDMDPKASLALIEMRLEKLDAGPFHQPAQEARG